MAAARAPERPVHAGDEPERHAQPAAAGVGQGEHRRPDRGGRAVGPRQRWSAAGVDLDDGEVAVEVPPGHAALGRPPVGEGDRDLIATHVVRVGQHPALGQDDARSDAPPLPDADHRGAGALRVLPDACLDLVKDCHRCYASSS